MSTTDYGPQTEAISALIERVRRLTPEEVAALATAWAWDAAPYASWEGVQEVLQEVLQGPQEDMLEAALTEARKALSAKRVRPMAVWCAVTDVVMALVVMAPINQAHYDLLTRPWRTAIGPAHPDDAPIEEHP